tara:strand:+ start:1038 stop:1559 length:522 start_codon:yes stop_codon:yes gene_type:complete
MTWQISQKGHFGGRGAKWVQVEGDLLAKLNERMNELSDFDFSNIKDHFDSAGFGWVRYSKPMGSESVPMAAFEIRWAGSKIDCPKSLFIIPESDALTLKKLGATPYKLNLEGKGDGNVKAPKKAIPKKERVAEMVSFGPKATEAINSKPSSSKEAVKKTEEIDFDTLCAELGI